jgi:hypothetical protein
MLRTTNQRRCDVMGKDEPIFTEGSFDSHNTAFWDSMQQRYVCYFRQSRDGKRSIRRSFSGNHSDKR